MSQHKNAVMRSRPSKHLIFSYIATVGRHQLSAAWSGYFRFWFSSSLFCNYAYYRLGWVRTSKTSQTVETIWWWWKESL